MEFLAGEDTCIIFTDVLFIIDERLVSSGYNEISRSSTEKDAEVVLQLPISLLNQ